MKNKIALRILIIVCLPTIYLFLYTAMMLGKNYYGAFVLFDFFWVAVFFIPINVVTLILLRKTRPEVIATNSRKKKIWYSIKHFILVLNIFAMTMISLSSFVNKENLYPKERYQAVQTEIAFELPQNVNITSIKTTQDNIQTYAKIKNKNDKAEFENKITSSNLWVEELPKSITNVFDVIISVESNDAEYLLFYNCTTKLYNEYPKENGEYKCILVTYDTELGKIFIVDNFVLSVEFS